MLPIPIPNTIKSKSHLLSFSAMLLFSLIIIANEVMNFDKHMDCWLLGCYILYTSIEPQLHRCFLIWTK